MPNIYPYAGKSAERLLAMVNADGGTNYALETDLTFGAVTAFTDSQGRNTRAVVIPTDSATFPRNEYVRYVRLPLSVIDQVPGNVYPTVQIDALPFTTHSILEKINAALGLDLEPDEVINEEHRSIAATYPLKIKVGASLAWLPSVYHFKANVGLADLLLMEDDTPMLMEDGTPMLLESAPTP